MSEGYQVVRAFGRTYVMTAAQQQAVVDQLRRYEEKEIELPFTKFVMNKAQEWWDHHFSNVEMPLKMEIGPHPTMKNYVETVITILVPRSMAQ